MRIAAPKDLALPPLEVHAIDAYDVILSNEKVRAMTSKKNDIRKPKGDSPSAEPASAHPGSGVRGLSPQSALLTPVAPAAAFPIVGIGASAGGLAAFEAFFSGLPAAVDPGMAFVLVQHLAPDHKSILADLIRRYTRMQVFEVEDGMVVQPNCAYIIPPNFDMAFLNGALHLLEPSAPRGQRLTIDFFFRSLAQDQHERAICIVLSGTGSDGTLGVRAIKGEGGMVMAQKPESAEYDGMPRSAIATGLVDYELPPSEMPAQLIAYVAHAFGHPPLSANAPLPKAEREMKNLFALLCAQTGHDFSQYKSTTIRRCIDRRMAVHQIRALDGYIRFLQQSPAEGRALFRNLLIGVTHFFCDPEVFKTLEEQVVPKLFAGRPSGDVVRVWVPACSTGEEAYSLAILLQERLEALKKGHKVQIFATDIDSQAIATARTGLYPASIAADISPERLTRFFDLEPGGFYRVHKSIRDLLIFSEQDLIKHPPFSKLDLISCRNILIYMGTELQKKLIPLFHYALNPGGFLFLGTSETVGEFGDLFGALDRKEKIYHRKDGALAIHRAPREQFLPPLTGRESAPPASAGQKTGSLKKPSVREVTERALLHVAPSAALVNGAGDILYLHGRTGMYLELAPGESGTNNILKMVHEGLRRDLITALHKAVVTNAAVRRPGLKVKTNDDFTTVNLTVRPVLEGGLPRPPLTVVAPEAPVYLVIFEEAATEPVAIQDDAKKEYFQFANDELKCSNEEMQSVNEKLLSANEELETSKEEQMSVNEELSTANNEMQTRMEDLSRANNDMNNLIAGTGIATVFVDCQQRILRFTPAATRMIHLIPGDVGRSVGHIVNNLRGYDRLTADVKGVLDTLVPRELEVQTVEGLWHIMRIQPYRTFNHAIEGAVLTFVPIIDRKRAEAALRERMKELTALYALSELAPKEDLPLEGLYQALACILPKACLYDESACCRIRIAGAEFSTTNFTETTWKLSAPVRVSGVVVGAIDICYVEKRPELDEGPFLKEERRLLDAFAERLGRIIERKQAAEALR